MNKGSIFHLCIAGSADFVRRMSLCADALCSKPEYLQLKSFPANLAEFKIVAIENRVQALMVEIGLRTSKADLLWIRQNLSELRDRFGKEIYIILTLTSPEKCAALGDLLFADEKNLDSSGLADNLIVCPPHGFPFALTLEAQLQDCLLCILKLFADSPAQLSMLPALGDPSWVPTMADPESRLVWMRYLPRYALYTRESPLVVGETGSGKTKLAAALHALSGRKGPFISITPRDFSNTELVHAELFGAVAGAYTGAVDKWGLVKKADKGTLFIDELQSIDLDLQGKLITFIENKTYRRVGDTEVHFADVRFVFASNKTLQQLVAEGKLRDDFAYRLERLQLTLKPLHERRLDIAAAICYALGKVARERFESSNKNSNNYQISHSPEGLTQAAYRRLYSASWPGNLRQLENTLARLAELANLKGLRIIDEQTVSDTLQDMLGAKEESSGNVIIAAAQSISRKAVEQQNISLREALAMLEEFALTKALETTAGDTQKAAELLNESPKTLELFASTRVAL